MHVPLWFYLQTPFSILVLPPGRRCHYLCPWICDIWSQALGLQSTPRPLSPGLEKVSTVSYESATGEKLGAPMPKFFQHPEFLPGQIARIHFWPLGTKGIRFFVLLFMAPTGKLLSILTSTVLLSSPYSCWSIHTFSFIFSIFFTELLRTCFSSMRTLDEESGERGVCRSSCFTDFPNCFSSCFSASFSLLWALMLSALYMW